MGNDTLCDRDRFATVVDILSIALVEILLAEPDEHRHVPLAGQLELLATEGLFELGPTTIQGLPPLPLDRRLAAPADQGDLPVRATDRRQTLNKLKVEGLPCHPDAPNPFFIGHHCPLPLL